MHPDKVLGGGDSAGGNMTAAICLRRMDEGRKPLAGQVLLYPEARLPFDTPAATEINSSLYLECNGIFGFASNYLPRSEGKPSVSSSATHLTHCAARHLPSRPLHLPRYAIRRRPPWSTTRCRVHLRLRPPTRRRLRIRKQAVTGWSTDSLASLRQPHTWLASDDGVVGSGRAGCQGCCAGGQEASFCGQ